MADKNKSSILLCWGYHRKGWIEPFERLKDEFDFTYLFYRVPDEEPRRVTDEPILYWNSFGDAYEVLNSVRPDKIVFMSLTSGYPIALNMAAQGAGIPTFILQHGVFFKYEDYRSMENTIATRRKEAGLDKNASVKSYSMSFLARTLRLRDVTSLPQMSLFFLILRRWGHTVASRFTRFRQRLPSGYICFTERNATIHRELDRAQSDQIHVIGIPEYDKFFLPERASESSDNSESSDEKVERYYLLIDQPLAENSWGTPLVRREEMIDFYRRLNEYCESYSARLKVKLHPESYGYDWLPEDDNVEWVRDTDVVALIRGAEGCFGMFSSLLLPAALLKPLCLFRVNHSSMVNDLSRRGLAVVLDFFDFEPQDIRFDTVRKSEDVLTRYAEEYFFKADGRSVERLRLVLSQ